MTVQTVTNEFSDDVENRRMGSVRRGTRYQVDPLDLVHALRRQGFRAGVIALPLAFLVAAAVFVLYTPKYRSSALLKLSPHENRLVFDGSKDTDFELFKGTQKTLIGTRLVMSEAIRNLNDSSVLRAERPVDWLMNNIRVETPVNTEIMMISVQAAKDKNPIALVNATVDAYLAEFVNRKRDARSRRLAEIEGILIKKQAEARQKRNDLKRLAEQLGSGDSKTLSIKQQLLIEELGLVRRQIIQLQMDQWSVEAKLRSFKMAKANPKEARESAVATPTEIDIDAAIANDSFYNGLIKDRVTSFRLQAEAQAAFKDGTESPFNQVQEKIEAEMAQRRDEIKEELAALAPLRQKARLKSEMQEIDQRIEQHTSELEVIERFSEQLSTDEERLLEEFKKVGNQSIDVEMMRSEISQLDLVMARISQQSEELKVEIQSQPRVEVLRKASEMLPVDQTKRAGLAGFFGALAFLLIASLVVFGDLASQRVNSAMGLVSRTGLEILGTLPSIPDRVMQHLGDDNSPRSKIWRGRMDESVKRISSRIAQLPASTALDSGAVYLITSAIRGEGKTSLANQLAMRIALSTRRVILCDYDLRHPTLHRIHHFNNSPGLSEVLCGNLPLSEVLNETNTEGLQVLTAGHCSHDAIKALAQGRVKTIIEQMRGMADVVIVDGCPILSSADIGYVCPHVDQVIFSVRRDFSRVPAVNEALHLLHANEELIAGAVVIDRCVSPVDLDIVVDSERVSGISS